MMSAVIGAVFGVVGVPRGKRGEIWELLLEQHGVRNPVTPPQLLVPYEHLLKQLTTYQHAILIDLGH